jgi:hypothetical protein
MQGSIRGVGADTEAGRMADGGMVQRRGADAKRARIEDSAGSDYFSGLGFLGRMSQNERDDRRNGRGVGQVR